VTLTSEDGSTKTELKYLLDGDEVVLEAWCGDKKLGFGECRGVVGAAK
jgi:fumarylacetoacetase